MVHSVNDLLLQLSKPSSNEYDFIILNLTQDILDSLSFLHELGMAHRDLKPDPLCNESDQKVFIVEKIPKIRGRRDFIKHPSWLIQES